MNPSDTRLNTNILLVAAAFVIVIAGVKSAASILIPFLLSIFIAILSAPVMRWLTRHRVPENRRCDSDSCGISAVRDDSGHLRWSND